MAIPRLSDGIRGIMEGLNLIALHRFLTQDFYSWLKTLFWPNGTLKLQKLDDADADKESLYFSNDSSKPVWKDAAGTKHDLY